MPDAHTTPHHPSRSASGPRRSIWNAEKYAARATRTPSPQWRRSSSPAYAARPGQAIRRELLLRDVWEYAPGLVARAPHHAMTRLRRKIEEDPSAPIYLKFASGAGERLEPFDQVPTTSDVEVARETPRISARPTVFIGRDDELAYLEAWLHGDASD